MPSPMRWESAGRGCDVRTRQPPGKLAEATFQGSLLISAGDTQSSQDLCQAGCGLEGRELGNMREGASLSGGEVSGPCTAEPGPVQGADMLKPELLSGKSKAIRRTVSLSVALVGLSFLRVGPDVDLPS